MVARGLFVTGTDTGVGKTLVSAALLRAIAATGRSTVGMKPVAAGRDNGQFHDVEALVAAGSVVAPRGLVNPYAFEPAIAPHIAAAEAGVTIEADAIAAALQELSVLADVVVVEGAGGFMIPLGGGRTSADLARRLGLPVVLVVGMRLGCLNHALLTRRVIATNGLDCVGWVANCIQPDMPRLEQNIDTLKQVLDAPLLGVVPFQHVPDSARVAGLLDVAGLC